LARFSLLRASLDDGIPLTRLAAQHGIPLRNVRRWLRAYQQQGLAGLARKRRTDRGKPRFPEDLVQLIEGLALRKPPPTAAAIHRQVSAIASEQGWQTPSYSAVYALIKNVDPALKSLAHDGAQAYREAFDLLYRREARRPNEVWQADHTPLDIWVLDEQGKPIRPWLTVILDDYSRAVASYRLSVQAPSALQTALALRDAIWRKTDPRWHVCGIPETFYTDHGSDFTSQHLEQVSADLKMALVFSMPGRPRGRGRIERFFLTVNQLFLSALPGYSPRGTPRPVPSLTLAELDQRLQTFVLDDYHHRIHGETGVAPLVRWETSGFLPQIAESLDQLDLLLLTVAKPRRVQQDGIHFEGLRYLDVTLAAYVGESVVIRYDPKDLGEIRVYYDNAYLCRAVCQELADRTIGLKEIVEARSQRRRRVRTELKERTKVVDLLLSAHSAEGLQTPASPEPAPRQPRLKRYIND
jgi:putative transposase